MPTVADLLLDELNRTYERLHTEKEDAFWTSKMGLSDDARAAQEECSRREIEWQAFLQDPAALRRARSALERAGASGEGQPAAAERPSADTLEGLRGWVRTFEAHAIESPQARALAAEIVEDEGRLERARAEMVLGYRHPERGFARASSVALATLLRVEPDERIRRAAWEGLATIEPAVLEAGFLELVAKRNRLGRMLGAEDYYDWKTRRVERLGKRQVFAWLDELEERTRGRAERALGELRARHGPAAGEPWNVLFLSTGDSAREQDPYFPFREALRRWGRSFAALAIDYADADLVLDLVDRPGKHENGFMHGPGIAWRERGRLKPARIHFTANAIPGMVGSGHRATETLFHEGGHAAHFANVDMPSPCFGQEFAPTSVAWSETQSMLLDSLLSDADWQARYARTAQDEPMPLAILERGLRASQPLAAWRARGMLAVCYGERALYEIPEDELSPARALEALREVERRFLFLERGAPRPTLAVPHLLAGESSAYYHGYVLAEMAVHQARALFLGRDGHLVDNPRLGPALRDACWRPGNSLAFGELVERLTGRALSAQALAEHVNRPADAAVERARADVARLAEVPEREGEVRLSARIRVVHGRERVGEADLRREAAGNGGGGGGGGGRFEELAGAFATWIDAREHAARG